MRLIDADAFAAQYGDYYAEEGTEEGFIGTVGALIAEQPTIKPEERRGEWIVNNRNPDYADCTNCGLSEWLGANGSRAYAETLLSGFKKFCPNCGARMGSADNESK